MVDASPLSRRRILQGSVVLGALGLAGLVPAFGAPAPRLPARGNFVIRNAYVMTMEPGQADLPKGDVHVDNGLIVDIGAELAASGADVIDAQPTFVSKLYKPTILEWSEFLFADSGVKGIVFLWPHATVFFKVLAIHLYQ